MRFYLTLPLVIIVTVVCSIVSVLVTLVDRSGRSYHRLMRLWSRTMLWLFGITVTVRGTGHLAPGAHYVYLANHSSYLDIIALGVAIPGDMRFIFKRELARIPIFGWGLALSPYILIDRADARDAMGSIERAAARVADGASVVIFPEGTRTHDGRLGAFKRGGFLLATLSGVPMVPVAIRGTYALLPRHSNRVAAGAVEVVIGTPIPGRMKPSRVEEQGIREEVRRQLEMMLSEAKRE